MKHLDFILWMVLFPAMVEYVEYISAKRKKINGEPKTELSEDKEYSFALWFTIMWFGIGYLLF